MKRLLIVAIFLLLSVGMAFAAALEDGIAAFNAKNYEKALLLLQPEAEQGVAAAQGLLARIYANGWGTSIDRKTAYKWAKLAAAKGDASGQVVLGVASEKGGGVPKDHQAAVKWYKLAADQGYALGQSNLGLMYRNGFGVTKDYAEALKWLRLAADQGNPQGQTHLGYMYRNGFGVAKDYAEALKWYRLSADQGYSVGQSSLGYMYLSGFGVTKDYEEALKWYRLAAAQSDGESQSQIGHMYQNGFGVAKDYVEAIKWYRLSAEQGNVFGQSNLGNMYECGCGLKQSYEEAARWYLLAAAQGGEYSKRKLEGSRAIKLAAESVIAKGPNQTPAELELNAVVQTTDLQETKAVEQERLAQEARAKDAARVEQAAKAVEQERLAQEARAKDAARVEQAAKVKEQERLAQIEEERVDKTRLTSFANRRALVIGNDSYKNVTQLLNAREDAKSIAASLLQFGYQVTLKMDLTEKEMKSALRTFKSQVEGGDEVLFFYAGHGVQLGSTNYLLPIDIVGESEEQIKDEAIQLQRILDDLTERKAKFSLAMIDACRDNPFKTSGRTLAGRGLSPTTAATGQMVIFSAGVGQQALDKLGPKDTNKNGLFTRIFLQEMQKPGVSIDRVVRSVRNQVVSLAKSVGHEQVPAIYDQVVGDFYFRK